MDGTCVPSADDLRTEIVECLEKQGFALTDGALSIPKMRDKDLYRGLQKLAVDTRLAVTGRNLQRHEKHLISYIADGDEVNPDAISPKLIIVESDSEYELLFRYTTLHWSIPVSPGYGRRLRFLVMDESNGKLIGLLGLGDPVFALQARDKWIGWDMAARKRSLYHVMDAYVLGAVPPYSDLLCGKLVALLALSNQVRDAFRLKYGDKPSLIKGLVRKPFLALITTSSALGRSSIYNRLAIHGFPYWNSVGYTQGSGDFHFSNGVYGKIRAFVEENCTATAKQSAWGSGFRNKREVIRKCLAKVGLPADLIYHGIQREIFVAPTGHDTLRFLSGKTDDPGQYDWSAHSLFLRFRQRWLLPRAERKPDFRCFSRDDYRLWPD